MIRSVNIIKTETISFIRIKTAHYIILTIVIIIIILVAVATVANIIQASILTNKIQTLQHEIDILQREQEAYKTLIEGQAQSQEKTDAMALTNTGRVFSLEKYRQWNKANSGGSRLPDWVHACNGQPVYIENNKCALVRGLDGEYRPSAPEWEVASAL